ncbi:LysR substrate binding domain protein [compost metagenome]
MNPIFESANVGTLKRVIEAGLGWGFLPATSIKKQVRSGRLNRVYLKDLSYEMDLMFYYKKNVENKALVEVFYQTLYQQEKA